MLELRPHQTLALDLLRDAIRSGKKRPVIAMPTGSGKTVLAAAIVNGSRSKGNRVCFVVPFLSLVDQTFERFRENGIDVNDMGVIQGDHEWRRDHAPVQIATAQTLSRRSLPETDIVVVDEAHIGYSVISSWLDNPGGVKLFVGLSATPWAAGMGKRWDHLIRPTGIADLTAQGLLAPIRAYAPSHPDLSAVKIVAGDYREDDLGAAMSKPELTGDIVQTWLKNGQGRPTICFAVNRAHAHLIHEKMNQGGVSAEYVDAYTPREERDAIGERLRTGETRVAVNIGTLTTGTDWPWASCAILARPTKSEALAVQMIGRVLRPQPGKTALILDHGDTLLTLGFPEDIEARHTELSTGTKKTGSGRKDRERPIALPKECKGCGALVPPAVRECPCCGHVNAPPPQVIEHEGELRELTREGRRAAKAAAKDAAKVPLIDRLRERGKDQIWAELRDMQVNYNWSDGRRAHVYRDIFGVWPRGLDDLKRLPASVDVEHFVRAKNIAFAKSRASAEGRPHV
jgi:DNA repair protein RadD